VPHLSGGKFTVSHTTVIEAAVPVAMAAAKLPCVTKIVLGTITQIKGPAVAKRLKSQEIPAGLKVTVRGSKTVQELYVYTTDVARTVSAMTTAL
jgi:hypothetical protein